MNPNTGEAKYELPTSRLPLTRLFAHHKHLLVAGSAWLSRIVMALVQLASIRVLMGALGIEQYAMFALLMGLLQWYMLSDVGLGISTQNRISECRARETSYDGFVVTAGVIAIALLFLSILALYFVSPFLAPRFLKAFPNISDQDKVRDFFLTGALFIGAGIGNISYKIWYAEQRGYLAHVFPAVASLLGLLGIVILHRSGDANTIYAFLLLFNAPSALLPLASLLLQIGRRANSLKFIDRPLIRDTLSRAAKFWVTAIIGTVVLQVDYLVISQMLSPQQIVIYVLSTKIFGFVAFFFTSILWALWPNFAESVSRGDWNQVHRSRTRCIRLGMLFVGGSTVALVFAMPYISEAMAPGQAIHIPLQLTLLLGAYQLIRVWTEVYSVILQSMNVLWPLWLFVPIQAVICVTLQYKLAPVYGVHGIVLGLIGSFVLTVIWGLPLAMNRHFQKIRLHS